MPMKIERGRKLPQAYRIPDLRAIFVPQGAEQRAAKVSPMVQEPKTEVGSAAGHDMIEVIRVLTSTRAERQERRSRLE